MNIDIALFAYLSDYQPDGLGGRSPRAFTLDDGTSVDAVIASLGLPDEPRIVFLNGRHAEEPDILHEGDRLAIFPPVAGG